MTEEDTSDEEREDCQNCSSHIGRVRARYHPRLAIVFSDIVGFTKMCHECADNPEVVMQMLNTLYTAMDDAADANRLCKIETIGDAYLAVAGLPGPTDEEDAEEVSTHELVRRALCFAADIIHAASEIACPNCPGARLHHK